MIQPKKRIVGLSFLQAALIGAAAIPALIDPSVYTRESFNWQIQTLGQDMIDVFLIIPLIFLSAYFTLTGKRQSFHIWGGVQLYILYTFFIYCFDIHFNRFFLIYCAILCMSFFSFIYYCYLLITVTTERKDAPAYLLKLTAYYFFIITAVFSLLWMSQIVPAIVNDTTPAGLVEPGLFTNPVHVLDLAFFLPAIFITAILLLRGKVAGLLAAFSLLTFTILMHITIGFLLLFMGYRGFGTNPFLAATIFLFAVMGALLLRKFLKIPAGVEHFPVAKPNMGS